MKIILLFAGYTYYPRGGWDDFKGDFNTYQEALREAEKLLKAHDVDWYQVVDTEDNKVINSTRYNVQDKP